MQTHSGTPWDEKLLLRQELDSKFGCAQKGRAEFIKLRGNCVRIYGISRHRHLIKEAQLKYKNLQNC